MATAAEDRAVLASGGRVGATQVQANSGALAAQSPGVSRWRENTRRKQPTGDAFAGADHDARAARKEWDVCWLWGRGRGRRSCRRCSRRRRGRRRLRRRQACREHNSGKGGSQNIIVRAARHLGWGRRRPTLLVSARTSALTPQGARNALRVSGLGREAIWPGCHGALQGLPTATHPPCMHLRTRCRGYRYIAAARSTAAAALQETVSQDANRRHSMLLLSARQVAGTQLRQAKQEASRTRAAAGRLLHHQQGQSWMGNESPDSRPNRD